MNYFWYVLLSKRSLQHGSGTTSQNAASPSKNCSRYFAKKFLAFASLVIGSALALGMPAHAEAPEVGNGSGIASWYGNPFHGRRTASGQIFDMNKLTGAHLTIPLSSKVRVRNPHNGKVVVITVNDRGPYIKKRVLDLSHEAAKQLGILSCGIAYINYTILPSANNAPSRADAVPSN